MSESPIVDLEMDGLRGKGLELAVKPHEERLSEKARQCLLDQAMMAKVGETGRVRQLDMTILDANENLLLLDNKMLATPPSAVHRRVHPRR